MAGAQEACSLAQRCLKRAQQRGASRQTAARVAASVLTRAAIDQGSSDNVTVVVVDLSRCRPCPRFLPPPVSALLRGMAWLQCVAAIPCSR